MRSKKILWIFIIALVLFLLVGCSSTSEVVSKKTTGKESNKVVSNKETKKDDEIDKIIESMSLEQKIAQMLVLECPVIPTNAEEYLKETPIGGIILMRECITSFEGTKNYVSNFQKNSPYPVIISIDHEGGSVQRLGYLSDVFVSDIPFMYNVGLTNNYDLAYNEVEKIDLYYKKGRSLSIDDVTNIVSRVMEDNNFKFIDAVMGRNIKEIFKIYDDLMLQKVEPLMLLAMIAKELRNSLLVKLLDGNKNEMMRTLGVKYEFQLDKWLNYSYTYTDVFLENKLIELADLNYKIKSGKVSSKLGLQLFLLDFCK